jgi:poly-gamma-glutamate capsule biosynthesis protein CapA/YwtB (metallophosphatase superfamily)
VVATFHFGREYQRTENARQRFLAGLALRAGAQAVIGAHAHVLQPVRSAGRRRVVAYGLGNFIWPSAPEPRTGILYLRLSARGVERARLRRGRIIAARPRV